MRYLLTLLFVLTTSIFVSAQNQTDYNKGEVFVGYSSHIYLDDRDNSAYVTSRGVNASGVYNFHRYWGVKVDTGFTVSPTVSQNFVPGFNNPTNATVAYSERISVSTFTAGIQVKDNSRDKRFKPFAHALFGVGRLEERVTNVSCTTVSNCSNVPPSEVSNGFALLLGGGLDIKLNKHIDIRAVQIDLSGIAGDRNSVNFSGGNADLRFATGIVFKF